VGYELLELGLGMGCGSNSKSRKAVQNGASSQPASNASCVASMTTRHSPKAARSEMGHASVHHTETPEKFTTIMIIGNVA